MGVVPPVGSSETGKALCEISETPFNFHSDTPQLAAVGWFIMRKTGKKIYSRFCYPILLM